MAFHLLVVVLVIGAVYGYLKKGRQDKSEIFKAGLMWGLVVAAVLAVLGFLLDQDVAGLGAGFISLVISFVVLTLVFIAGVFVGDWLEHR